MRRWFKHEYGFVNIDDKNLYLTNSGNWSDTLKLTEKTPQTIKKSKRKALRINSYLAVCFMAFAILFALVFSKGSQNTSFLWLLPIGAYFLYDYLKPEVGPTFLIPIVKIEVIEMEDTSATIHFLTLANTKDQIHLTKINKEGLAMLEQLGDASDDC